MRTLSIGKVLSSVSLGAGLLALCACSRSLPPKELADARTEYMLAMQGPAATETPAELHSAQTSLEAAERTFSDDGDSPQTRDKAYVALRKVELADSAARIAIANKAKAEAELQAQQFQTQSLKNTQTNLTMTQEQLLAEKQGRAAAEKQAAQALADLARIASIKQETRGTVITLSGSVLFKTDEASLLPDATQKLNDVADALIKSNPDANITIEGHTDSQGAHDHNMLLSQQRAESVKSALVGRGVAADRIKTVGVGPDRPLADNKSAEGRANNRRVEIVVEPSKNGGPSSITK